MTGSIVADQTRFSSQRRAAQSRQAPARASARAPRIGVKNIEGRIRNSAFKIKNCLHSQKI